jgi:flagellar biosynthetic protein FliR
METLLQDIIVTHVFAFLLIFMRFGTALMLMPGIGDSFVSPQIRLAFAIAFCFLLTPFLASSIPPMPASTPAFILLLLAEGLIGIFIGTVMRIMMTALDTAGSTVSIQAGFANAMVFNPATATQGSLVGALYSMLGVALLFIVNLHHFLLAAVVESYTLFPADGSLIEMGSVAAVVTRAVSTAFKTGVQMAMPFIVAGLLVHICFGLLGRLMPQVQIFFIALPVQILMSLILLTMVLSAGMIYWLNTYAGTVSTLLGF